MAERNVIAVRDRLVERWLRSNRAQLSQKRVRFTTCRWSF